MESEAEMTEEEEFEFRLRLEREQASAPTPVETKPAVQRRETTAGGIGAESLKGVTRGLYDFAQSSEQFNPLKPAMILLKQLGLPVPNRKAGQEQITTKTKAAPDASVVEQMFGTGSELAAKMLPFAGGGVGNLAQKALSVAVPAAGGAIGEQIGGETGKLVGSIAAPFAQAGVSRVMAPRNEALRELVEAGVRPSPGQVMGGIAKRAERIPVIREFTGSTIERANNQFNQATLNRVLTPIGQKVDDIGFQGFAKAHQAASDAYDAILPNITAKYDITLARELSKVHRDIPKGSVRAEAVDIFNNVMRPYLTRPAQKGVLTGSEMKQIDSEIGRLARAAQADPAMDNRLLSTALYNMQGVLRQTVERQNPKFAQPLRDVNKTWANLVRVENAVNAAYKTEGVFSPAQLQQSVKQMDPHLRHGAFAKYEAVLQDWSTKALRVLGEPANPSIPYSLANKALWPTAAAGAAMGGMGVPIAIGAAGVGSVYNPLTQSLFAQAAVRRPDWMRKAGMAVAPTLQEYGIGMSPLFSQGEQ